MWLRPVIIIHFHEHPVPPQFIMKWKKDHIDPLGMKLWQSVLYIVVNAGVIWPCWLKSATRQSNLTWDTTEKGRKWWIMIHRMVQPASLLVSPCFWVWCDWEKRPHLFLHLCVMDCNPNGVRRDRKCAHQLNNMDDGKKKGCLPRLRHGLAYNILSNIIHRICIYLFSPAVRTLPSSARDIRWMAHSLGWGKAGSAAGPWGKAFWVIAYKQQTQFWPNNYLWVLFAVFGHLNSTRFAGTICWYN